MRNWNFSNFGLSATLLACFYSTYEELKRDTAEALGIEVYCFYSTYEELKRFRSCGVRFTIFSFYSTYEELKLQIIICYYVVTVLFLQYLWGIETPGSSSICSKPSGFLQYLWGIETEIVSEFNDGIFKVFTVPMRNWNKNVGRDAIVNGIVFTVPMRNWNFLLLFP